MFVQLRHYTVGGIGTRARDSSKLRTLRPFGPFIYSLLERELSQTEKDGNQLDVHLTRR